LQAYTLLTSDEQNKKMAALLVRGAQLSVQQSEQSDTRSHAGNVSSSIAGSCSYFGWQFSWYLFIYIYIYLFVFFSLGQFFHVICFTWLLLASLGFWRLASGFWLWLHLAFGLFGFLACWLLASPGFTNP
jgi:hypothetical protein